MTPENVTEQILHTLKDNEISKKHTGKEIRQIITSIILDYVDNAVQDVIQWQEMKDLKPAKERIQVIDWNERFGWYYLHRQVSAQFAKQEWARKPSVHRKWRNEDRFLPKPDSARA